MFVYSFKQINFDLELFSNVKAKEKNIPDSKTDICY